MRMLLGWAEMIAFFEGDGDGYGVEDGEDGDDFGVEGSDVLKAAERLCEFLGDEDGVVRVGELVW
jgi:hypothetical protein